MPIPQAPAPELPEPPEGANAQTLAYGLACYMKAMNRAARIAWANDNHEIAYRAILSDARELEARYTRTNGVPKDKT